MRKNKYAFRHILDCAIDIHDYCTKTDRCENCYFYSVFPNGHVECLIFGEPHNWKLGKAQKRNLGGEK